MSDITFITRGVRSGKSKFALHMAESQSTSPIYLATAHIWDHDFLERIKKHQKDRGEQWETIEEEIYISRLEITNKTVLLDCITLWLTNIFHMYDYKIEPSLNFAKK